jgi:hypothetical protein
MKTNEEMGEANDLWTPVFKPWNSHPYLHRMIRANNIFQGREGQAGGEEEEAKE